MLKIGKTTYNRGFTAIQNEDSDGYYRHRRSEYVPASVTQSENFEGILGITL